MKFFKLLPAILFLFSLSVLEGEAAAQSKSSGFNVKNFLQRLDKNQNGKLEPGEIPDDRTRSFLKNAGVDTDKSVDINSFSKDVSKKKSERREARRKARSKTNMPGFAVDHDNESTMGFAVANSERETIARTASSSFSESSRKMADWVLGKYDKNKDGKLSPDEIKGARWQDPPAKDSDTNKDGTLSKVELLRRYQKREEGTSKKDSNRSSRSSSRESRSRDRFSRSPDRSSRKSSKKTVIKTSTTTDKKNKNLRRGYEAYVEGIFKKFDENSDGKLDKAEIDKMRRKPDKGADTNKDGNVSSEELLNSYLTKAGQDPVRGSSGSGKSSAKSKSSSGSATMTTSSGAKPREPLTDMDKNKNGQIEMAEFLKDYTQSSFDKFNKKDLDGDGIITRREWER